MNRKILKNGLRKNITLHFRGKDRVFKKKSSWIFDIDDEEQFDLYQTWLKIYGGLIYDITPNEGK